ncbi:MULTISPECIES: peptidoglycan DD-metalloendopeptidase family protein [unclassified Iodidimonas]|uniref:M23 family metallopeptidase n=1 Tax=unclassified Iodidimonas TaxID=2626145 RepID=UPI0024821DC0|nr:MULTISPECIES: peptidoglycan DD-metalloendopeptidase family protein [unclassified Iodidimonas]
MRIHKEHILRQATQLFERAFPERQIFFRTRGEVRFARLSPLFQASVSVVALGLIAWTLTASISYLTDDNRVATKQQELKYVSHELNSLLVELERLKSSALDRAERLEARQKFLEKLAPAATLKTAVSQQPNEDAAGNPSPDGPLVLRPPLRPQNTSDAADVDMDKAHETGNEPAQDDLSSVEGDHLDEGARLNPSGTQWKAANFANAAMGGLGISGAQAAPTLDLMSIPSSSDAVTSISESLDLIIEKLDRVERNQDRTAQALILSEQKNIERRHEVIASLGIPYEALLKKADPPSGTGGPFTSADPSIFSQIFKKLGQLAFQRSLIDQAIANIPSHIPAAKYYISSQFGARIDPFRKSWADHSGLDMAGWPGEPIMAAAAGTVVTSARKPAYGLMVEIDHGNGFRTRYGHMRSLSVKSGERVKPGQKIGEMGSTGRSTSTHLHWEVWFNGALVDPLPFIEAALDVQALQQGRYEEN